MNSGFHDPIAVKKTKKENSPWNFDAPTYDERSSNFVNAGDHYGVGHRQPVGHSGDPKSSSPVLPMGKVKTMSVDQIPKKNLRLDINA